VSSEAAVLVAAVAFLALAMVLAMVQWSRRLLEAPLPAAGEGLLRKALACRAARRWGMAYAILWIVLLGAYSELFAVLGDLHPGRSFGLLVAVAIGWIGCNLLIVWFGRALRRTGKRTAAMRGPTQDRSWTQEPDAGVDTAATRIEPPPAATPSTRRGGRLLDLIRAVAWFGGVFLLLALGRTLVPLHNLEVWFMTHQRAFLLPLGVVAMLGFLLFLGSAVAMVLSQGTPMTRAEIEALERQSLRARLGPGRVRWAAVRVPRTAVGAHAEDGASFAEIKAAFHARAWLVSPRWRHFFLMTSGVFLLMIGLFGAGIVIAPEGVKLLLAAALLYACVRTAWGFSRA